MTTRIIYSYQRYRVQKRYLNLSPYRLLGLTSKYVWYTIYNSKLLEDCKVYQETIHIEYELENKKTTEFQPIIKTS